jgi:hypothetical protein
MNTLHSQRNNVFLHIKWWFPNMTCVGQVRELGFHNRRQSELETLKTCQMNVFDLFQSYNIHNTCFCNFKGLFKSHDLFYSIGV